MKPLVKLRTRPSRDGCSFKYFIDFVDDNGKRRQVSLGHADKKKADRQVAQKERELQMGIVEPESMRLSSLLKDSLQRTKGQVRESTLTEYDGAMRAFINCVGDIDFLKVNHRHGEQFVQYCLEKGNAPATTAKKLRHLKRIFQQAHERGQIEVNPLRNVKQPKSAKKKVRTFSQQQCLDLVRCSSQFQQSKSSVKWELLIRMALYTGMRRGELLNITWRDIDFDKRTVDVNPKVDTDSIWTWFIKDTDRRTLPLTDEVVDSLATLQSTQPEGHPYVFVFEKRYKRIGDLRRVNKWSVSRGRCPLNNFDREFEAIRLMASIQEGTFHDLRRTCLSNWLSAGLSEFEVMTLAGHAKFETTRRFYLAVNDTLIDRARSVLEGSSKSNSVARLLRTPIQDHGRL